MLKSFFGSIPDGRLDRVSFLWRFALVLAMFLGLSLALGLTGGISRVSGIYFVMIAVLGFTGLNLTAKRLRDLALPGWISLLIAVAIGVLLTFLLPTPIEIFYLLAIIAALAITPGRIFAGRWLRS